MVPRVVLRPRRPHPRKQKRPKSPEPVRFPEMLCPSRAFPAPNLHPEGRKVIEDSDEDDVAE